MEGDGWRASVYKIAYCHVREKVRHERVQMVA